MMLNHIGQGDVAARVNNAWLKTIEDGIHTYDIYKEGVSTRKVGTKEFAEAVIANLGKMPSQLKTVSYKSDAAFKLPRYVRKEASEKVLAGVDLFVHWRGTDPEALAQKVQALNRSDLSLSMITNRGIKVWPDGFEETFCTDHWRCRFKPSNGARVSKKEIVDLLNKAIDHDIDTIKTENLYTFNGTAAYSLGQGQ